MKGIYTPRDMVKEEGGERYTKIKTNVFKLPPPQNSRKTDKKKKETIFPII